MQGNQISQTCVFGEVGTKSQNINKTICSKTNMVIVFIISSHFTYVQDNKKNSKGTL